MNNEKKDAIERVKQMVADAQVSQDVVERYFPELKEKESEGERIKRCIIDTLKGYHHLISTGGVTKTDMLAWLEKQIYTKKELRDMGFAFNTNGDIVTPKEQEKDLKSYIEHEKEKWLEKQGEQKPTAKFHKDDWVVYECGDETVTLQIARIVAETYEFTDESIINVADEDTLHLWTIRDAKDGDVLTSPSHRLIWIYKDNEHYHACVNMNYVEENVHVCGEISIPNDTCPANNDERTILFSNMKKSGYKFDKKELKKIEQELSEWSDYDENGYGDALRAIEQATNVAKDENDMGKLWSLWSAERWLRSLKERLQRRGEEPSIVKWARK